MESPKETIIPVNINEEMKKSFISYAMTVIVSRALPDVRDGLKPVHRRILYSMGELGVTPDKPFRKSARIVGDVLGKYHPHGDTAVYDAMVRLAQDFSIRNMLVEGHGNFGSVDGDSAAAMRYTEARLSRIAMEMLRDIDKDTVNFYPNFDETLMQPEVLPARFPNLLVNGSGGIAVGMATNIPPHNLGETIDATVALIDDPELSVDDLMEYLPGPDFPTGGIILGKDGIRQAYRTGRGKVLVRAKTDIEVMSSNRSRIVVTELPYQVNKARLVEKIAELIHEKRIEGISDLRDESDRSGMRVAIELKRDVNANVILNSLFKHTQMQDTFGIINLALVDGQPQVLNLKQILEYYLLHQQDVVTRRTRYDLNKARERAHILEGLLIALDNIDAVVALIRSSKDMVSARNGLMENFGLSQKQAQAILDMRLGRLTALEREKIEEEYNGLMALIQELESILSDHGKLMGIIRKELLEIRQKYADPRRTEITFAAGDIDWEDMIQEEDMVVTLTHFGYVKRVPMNTYRVQRRGGRGVAALSTREEDFVQNVFVTSTHSPIMFFTNKGRAFRIKCYEIPEAGRTARGTAIVNLLQLAGDEKVTAIIPVPKDEASSYLLLATRRGVVKKTHLSEFSNIRKGGIIAQVLREGDELIGVALTDGDRDVMLATRHGLAIRFNEKQVRPMGRISQGVRGIDLMDEDRVVSMALVEPGADVLTISEHGYGKRTLESEYKRQNRGGKGLLTMNRTEKTGDLVGLTMITDEEDIMLISYDGTIIRMGAEGISHLSRNTQGVRLMRVQGDSAVVSFERVAKSEEDGEEELTEAEAPAEETQTPED
ncbi:DNA gyrase subunit A [Gehongia tenuis]|uniref:DNA gyrase subunit A n=1 Tax=Gehongia tenuis TaxID=2763655 RepID=A0A926HLG7_9FIRM|nr:DNA gyrase subunit A [Gehongia tenuis]MBC8532052.1 DNA gyrase subunit A [Gehongia tenuis]